MLRVHLFTPKSHTGASKFAPSTFIRPKPPPKNTTFLTPRISPRLVSQETNQWLVSFSRATWLTGTLLKPINNDNDSYGAQAEENCAADQG